MKDRELTLSNYEQVIETNKAGLWKHHPLKTQIQNGEISSISLRMQTNKEDMNETMKTGLFKNSYLTRNYGRNWRKMGDLATEKIVTANDEGLFIIEPEIL